MNFWKKIRQLFPDSSSETLYHKVWRIGEVLLLDILQDEYGQEILEENISSVFGSVNKKRMAEEIQHEKTFIERIWKNKRADFYRKRARKKAFIEQLSQKQHPKEEKIEQSKSSHQNIAKELYQLAGLTPKRIKVMQLRELENLSHEEIATELKIEIASSQQLYKNGRNQFQNWLMQQVGISPQTYKLITIAQQKTRNWEQVKARYDKIYASDKSIAELEFEYQSAYRKLSRWLLQFKKQRVGDSEKGLQSQQRPKQSQQVEP